MWTTLQNRASGLRQGNLSVLVTALILGANFGMAERVLGKSFSALAPGKGLNDSQTSIIYVASTGEVAVDPMAENPYLRSITITSETGIFGGPTPGNVLSGQFDIHTADTIFKSCSEIDCVEFGAISFGPIARPGLTKEFLLRDLSVAAESSRGVVDFGEFDLVYAHAPEPTTFALLLLGLALWGSTHRRHCAVKTRP
jgi:hypothetical protein